ncbi:MAG: M3 family oligoendopeptidase [Oscillospiraceae bacterium]|jgi:M3 family oligoendopeptidase|nr:M3 family oligoendopeptidase [Oscillospiraceae bacterium]
MKFKDMPYRRVSFEEAKAKYEELEQRLLDAKTPAEALEVLREQDTFTKELGTMFALAYVRNTLDTTDAFYEAEQAYIDETSPRLGEYEQRFLMALLESPHRPALEKEIGALYFTNAEIAMRVFSPDVIGELQEENRLTTEYQKLIASAQIEYDGKTLTLAQITPYHRDKDRKVRESSMLARAGWFDAQKGRLDSLFDELVKLRAKIAEKLGYPSFVELGYDRMTRNCYGAQDVAKFREMIVTHIVPLALRLKQKQAARIGADTDTGAGKAFLKLFDDPFVFPDGNPTPIGTPEDIFAHGKKMYHALSPETAEFIDVMLENDLFDVLTRPGKAGGGYCITLAAYKLPFIFANFNGTADDIDVLTHEAGHAFADYRNRDAFPHALSAPTYEGCEVHSMSMEFFAWPYMEGFFGDQTEKYRFSHLESALTFLPYGTMVDHFQHIVYENPNLTPKERNDEWLKLEETYRPWLDNSMPFYGEGRRWQAQGHIYERPFYYIDYCLAQTVALAFWALAQKDYAEAWARYMRYTDLGGSDTFTNLISRAGMPSPFGPDALTQVARTAEEWLEK